MRPRENDDAARGQDHAHLRIQLDRYLGLGLLTRVLADLLRDRRATIGVPSIIVMNIFPLNHNSLGYWHDELPAPFTNVVELLHNFVL